MGMKSKSHHRGADLLLLALPMIPFTLIQPPPWKM